MNKFKYQTQLNKIASSIGITETKNLNVVTIEKIFLKSYENYEKYNITLDMFSSIAGWLWEKVDHKTSELAIALYAASELNFYLMATIKTKKHLKSLENFLDDLRQYLDVKQIIPTSTVSRLRYIWHSERSKNEIALDSSHFET